MMKGMNANRTRIAACVAGGICFALLLACALCAPETNAMGVGPVTLSRDSGFYGEAFDLELRFDGGKIYYTLDSSDPDETATLYEGPIHIADASENPNVYSMITDVSLEFSPEILKRSGQKPRFGYQTPEALVDKATVVRAVGIDDAGNRSDVVNAVYFVGFDEKPGYDGLGIITVTTDPDNLFDYEKGIYVTGKTFADYLEDGYYKATKTVFEQWPCNYTNRGIDWEREASVCCFDADRNIVFSGNYGIRIQGGVSRGMLPKSLNLFARKQYGQETFSGMDLFGQNWQPDSVTLTGGSLSYKAKVHDALINEMAEGLDIDTRVYKPYLMFLDGEYWGLYWLTPRYEKAYFQYKYGVEGDDVVMIKQGALEIGREEDLALYEAMNAYICDNDMSDPAAYARACEMIDVQSCIDYYATEIYISNMDWPQKNTALWRTRGTNSGAYGDGRWRWILFDVNVTLRSKRAGMDYVEHIKRGDSLFGSLMENETFAAAFYARLTALSGAQFDPARVEAWLRDYEIRMLDAIGNDYARFFNNTLKNTDFIDACERYIQYFYDRREFCLENYVGGEVNP